MSSVPSIMRGGLGVAVYCSASPAAGKMAPSWVDGMGVAASKMRVALQAVVGKTVSCRSMRDWWDCMASRGRAELGRRWSMRWQGRCRRGEEKRDGSAYRPG